MLFELFRKDSGQEEKVMTEKETVGWHHWLNGHELEQTHGDDKGQGSLTCYSSWCHKEPDPRLRRLSFEYPGSDGAGPWQITLKTFFWSNSIHGRNSLVLFLVSKFWLWNKTYTSRCSFSTRVLNQSHIIFCSTTCVLASVCNCIYSDFYIDYYQFHSFTNYII